MAFLFWEMGIIMGPIKPGRSWHPEKRRASRMEVGAGAKSEKAKPVGRPQKRCRTRSDGASR